MTQRHDHASQCAGKIRHPDRREARVSRRRTPGGPLHIYRCPWCNGYHLGHIDHAVKDAEARQAAAADAADRRRAIAELELELELEPGYEVIDETHTFTVEQLADVRPITDTRVQMWTTAGEEVTDG